MKMSGMEVELCLKLLMVTICCWAGAVRAENGSATSANSRRNFSQSQAQRETSEPTNLIDGETGHNDTSGSKIIGGLPEPEAQLRSTIDETTEVLAQESSTETAAYERDITKAFDAIRQTLTDIGNHHSGRSEDPESVPEAQVHPRQAEELSTNALVTSERDTNPEEPSIGPGTVAVVKEQPHHAQEQSWSSQTSPTSSKLSPTYWPSISFQENASSGAGKSSLKDVPSRSEEVTASLQQLEVTPTTSLELLATDFQESKSIDAVSTLLPARETSDVSTAKSTASITNIKVNQRQLEQSPDFNMSHIDNLNMSAGKGNENALWAYLLKAAAKQMSTGSTFVVSNNETTGINQSRPTLPETLSSQLQSTTDDGGMTSTSTLDQSDYGDETDPVKEDQQVEPDQISPVFMPNDLDQGEREPDTDSKPILIDFNYDQSYADVDVDHPEFIVNKPTTSVSQVEWFVLQLKGKGTVANRRQADFVKYLKVNLAARLSADYGDIDVTKVVLSEYGSSIYVNITLDTAKLSTAERVLSALSENNSTILELSGQEFILTKLINRRPLFGTKPPTMANETVKITMGIPPEVFIYCAAGTACIFLLLASLILTIVRNWRSKYDMMESSRHPYGLSNPGYSTCSIRPQDLYLSKITQPRVIYDDSFLAGYHFPYRGGRRYVSLDADNNRPGNSNIVNLEEAQYGGSFRIKTPTAELPPCPSFKKPNSEITLSAFKFLNRERSIERLPLELRTPTVEALTPIHEDVDSQGVRYPSFPHA